MNGLLSCFGMSHNPGDAPPKPITKTIAIDEASAKVEQQAGKICDLEKDKENLDRELNHLNKRVGKKAQKSAELDEVEKKLKERFEKAQLAYYS